MPKQKNDTTILCLYDGESTFNSHLKSFRKELTVDENANFEAKAISVGSRAMLGPYRQLKIIIILSHEDHLLELNGLSVSKIPDSHTSHFLWKTATWLNNFLPDEITKTNTHLSEIMFYCVDAEQNKLRQRNSLNHQLISRVFCHTWTNANIQVTQLFGYDGINDLKKTLNAHSGVHLKKYSSAPSASSLTPTSDWPHINFSRYQQMWLNTREYWPIGLTTPVLLLILYKVVKDALHDEISVSDCLLILITLIGIWAMLVIPQSKLYKSISDALNKINTTLDGINGVIELSQEQLSDLKHQIATAFDDLHKISESSAVILKLLPSQVDKIIDNHDKHAELAITLTYEQIKLFNTNLDKNSTKMIELTIGQLQTIGHTLEKAIETVTQRIDTELHLTLSEARKTINSSTQVLDTFNDELKLTSEVIKSTLNNSSKFMNTLSNTINYHGNALDTKLGGFLNKLQGSTDNVARSFVNTTEVFRGSIRRFQSEVTQLSNNTNMLLQNADTNLNHTSRNINRQIRVISGKVRQNLDSTNNFINELDSKLGAFLCDLANVANHFQGDIANEAKNLIAAIDKGIQTGKFKPEVYANANVRASVCTIM